MRAWMRAYAEQHIRTTPRNVFSKRHKTRSSKKPSVFSKSKQTCSLRDKKHVLSETKNVFSQRTEKKNVLFQRKERTACLRNRNV